jgi:hypothetical protein
MWNLRVLAFASLFVVGLSGVGTMGRTLLSWPLRIAAIATPAAADSAQPQLTVSSRGVLLSWIERSGGLATLKFSERAGGKWSPARVVASGSDWFVNWADVPSVARLAGGALVAHWLQKSGTSTYAYDVRLAYSSDDGETWSPSFTPHHDGTPTEHGFVSVFPSTGDGVGLVWLDGRATGGGDHGGGHGASGMSLRFGAFDRAWKQTADLPIDPRVCDCCPTAAAITSDGPIVAYRDRSDQELRDIFVTRWDRGSWTAGVPVSRDGWHINACPVNGPSVSARGKQVVVAWFTGANDKPRALAAFSTDAGRSFGPPIRLDDEASLGRVDVELLPDGSAAAAYIEFAGQRPQLRIRHIQPDGSRSDPVPIVGLGGDRSSGYPRMALHDGELLFAWTDREPTSQVRAAIAKLPQSRP